MVLLGTCSDRDVYAALKEIEGRRKGEEIFLITAHQGVGKTKWEQTHVEPQRVSTQTSSQLRKGAPYSGPVVKEPPA